MVSCSACGCGLADVVPAAYYGRCHRSLAPCAGETALYGAGAGEASTPEVVEPGRLIDKAGDSARRIDALRDSKDARIPDLGCSTSSLLAGLGRLGYRRPKGVGSSPATVRIASSRPATSAEVGTLASLRDALREYESACPAGALGHLWDVPGAVHVLPRLRRLAAPSGMETVSETSLRSHLTVPVTTGCAAVVWGAEPGLGLGDADGHDDAPEEMSVALAERAARSFATIEAHLEVGLENPVVRLDHRRGDTGSPS